MSGIGHIGELQTIDFLKKKKGMAIYLPIKDVGLDFVGVKNNILYQFQIKTSTLQKNSYFWFDLYESKMVYDKNVYYVFVCYTMPRRKLMGKSQNFFVIPSLILKKWIESGDIAYKGKQKNILNIFLYPNFKTGFWQYKNKGKQIDWTEYWNDFSFKNLK